LEKWKIDFAPFEKIENRLCTMYKNWKIDFGKFRKMKTNQCALLPQTNDSCSNHFSLVLSDTIAQQT